MRGLAFALMPVTLSFVSAMAEGAADSSYRMPFQALSTTDVVVLGGDGNLWLEHTPFAPPGGVPPKREQIDDSAQAFQAFSQTEIIVLGEGGNLWLEQAPFAPPGGVPPKREQIDANVAGLSFRLQRSRQGTPLQQANYACGVDPPPETRAA